MAGGITQHTVLLNLSRLSPAQIKRVEALIGSLQHDPQFGILDYTGLERLDKNAETKANFNRNMTHSFTMHFASSVHRDHYLPHRKHQAIGKALRETYKLSIPGDVVPADTRAKLSAFELLDLHTAFSIKHGVTIFRALNELAFGSAYIATLAITRDLKCALRTIATARRATVEDLITSSMLWNEATTATEHTRKPVADFGSELVRNFLGS